jgi:hypothetical protein
MRRALQIRNNRAASEALGCFVMLLLGAFLTLGVIAVSPMGISELLRGHHAEGLRLILTWVIAPAVGIALVAWLTYGVKRPRDSKKRW